MKVLVGAINLCACKTSNTALLLIKPPPSGLASSALSICDESWQPHVRWKMLKVLAQVQTFIQHWTGAVDR